MKDRTAEWLELAKQARAIAEGMRDPRAKQTMMDIATAYDRLVATFATNREGLTDSDAE